MLRGLLLQGSLSEALRDLDAGVEALAKEHQQCLKAALYAVPPIWKRSSRDGQLELPTGQSLDSTIGAPDSPVMRELAKPANAQRAMILAANGSAAPAPEKKAGPVCGRLDMLTVSSEAPELTQHPLIAAEEVGRCGAVNSCWHWLYNLPCQQQLGGGGWRTTKLVQNVHVPSDAQVSFAAQLDSFLTQVRKQREQLLDLSADVQLQVQAGAQPMHVPLYELRRCNMHAHHVLYRSTVQ